MKQRTKDELRTRRSSNHKTLLIQTKQVSLMKNIKHDPSHCSLSSSTSDTITIKTEIIKHGIALRVQNWKWENFVRFPLDYVLKARRRTLSVELFQFFSNRAFSTREGPIKSCALAFLVGFHGFRPDTVYYLISPRIPRQDYRKVRCSCSRTKVIDDIYCSIYTRTRNLHTVPNWGLIHKKKKNSYD